MSTLYHEVSTWLYGILSALVAGCIFLIRKIITNEQQINLLKQEISVRKEYEKDRDAKIEEQIKELRQDVKALVNIVKGNDR